MKLTWGDHEVPAGEQNVFELGALQARFERSAKDWRVEYTYHGSSLAPAGGKPSRVRTVFNDTQARLTIRPACPNRNVVAMPVDTIHIPAGERVTIYMSSPVWMQAIVHADAVPLVDLPAEPLSDTWFGPNTRHGELCYSSRSSGRVLLDQLPVRAERIVTPATFVNEGEDPIKVDRVNLPMPLLSIYQMPDSLWTQEVTIKRQASLAQAEVDFRPAPPAHLPDAALIAAPREQQSGSSITRTLSMLFS